MPEPLPQGFSIDPPKRDPRLFQPLFDSGVEATNGFRTKADIARLKAQGYKPASNSLHLDGDALDLTPGGSGLSMAQLHARAKAIADAWPGGKALNEGNHVHVQLPGWGMAPGTPGTPNAGMPELPADYRLETRGSLRPGNYAPAPGKFPGSLVPTGEVRDGDTFALKDGRNARLFGVDAFELEQSGQRRDGTVVPLGQHARETLRPFALPGALALPTGKSTYGRPVATLERGGDAGKALLERGVALAAPSYLEGNELLGTYMEAERLARLNRTGAHGLTYQTPQSQRAGYPDPWAAPEASTDGKGVAVFADDPTPFQGLRPEIEAGYMSIWQDMNSTPADLLAFAKANNFTIDPAEVRAQYADRAKTKRPRNQVFYRTPPRILTDVGDGAGGAFVRGVADPINMLDEMGAVADTFGLSPGRENIWSSDRRFGDVLWNNLDQNRSILGYDDMAHPYARLGGQLSTAILSPVGAGARTPLALGKIGMIEGGLAGAGARESWQDRYKQGLLGTVIGGVGGAVLGRTGQVVAETRLGQRLLSRIPEPVEAASDASPIVNAGVQNAGPTPAVRSQGSAGLPMDDLPAVRVGPVMGGADGIPPLPEGATLLDPIGGYRPIGEPVDPANMAALFRGTDPQSLLPRPGNVVTSLDEAMTSNPGSFQRVTAPDEHSFLTTRRLPSPNDLYRSQYVRGPLDTTQMLRRLGGVKDYGGELAHSGIDGAPRRLDFGGGEQFLGRLLNNDNGLELDEATHRLWEMGYFPDHATRPTTEDLVQRLRQEAMGERFFTPDDMAEVGEFETAQANRFALEAQEAQRGPIYERVGSELDFDDLAANQPPASAYEDMPRLTGRVGNINLDKIEKPEDTWGKSSILSASASGASMRPAVARSRMRKPPALPATWA